jgi:hypothetical protein
MVKTETLGEVRRMAVERMLTEGTSLLPSWSGAIPGVVDLAWRPAPEAESPADENEERTRQRAQLRAMQTTMRSVNAIVRTFLSQMGEVRQHLENSGQTAMLVSYDRIVCHALDRLQVLSSVEEYRERELGEGRTELDLRPLEVSAPL